jgi:nucleotide-binding universal stress UspA family protein
MKKKHFLIATDGSPGACEAVEHGAALAREAGAAITLVSVRHASLPC